VPDRAPPQAAVAHQAAPLHAARPAGQDAGPRLPGAAAPADPPVMPAAAAAEITALLDEAFGPEPG
jgi:hypothetical protein